MVDKVGCPFCGKSEGQCCEHLLATHSDTPDGELQLYPFADTPLSLPYLEVEYDSPLVLLRLDDPGLLGDLSDMFDAYEEGLFEPPAPAHLFSCISRRVSTPLEELSTCVFREFGRYVTFAVDRKRAKAEISEILES